MLLRHEIITEPARLTQLHAPWEALLARSATSDPTVAPFWQETWWNVFGGDDGRRMRSVAFFEDDRLVGLAPFLWRRHWYRPGIPLRRVELMASGEPEEHEICSEYNGIIAERGAESAVADELVDVLSEDVFGPWDELEMPMMSGDHPLLHPLVRALEHAGHPVVVETETSAPYIPLPSTWDAYLKSLPSASRYLVNRTLRDLDAWADGQVSYHRAEQRDDIAYGSAILQSLHGDRWSKDGGHGGAFRSEVFRSFHSEMMDRLHERNALELSWLSVRGEPIAALYNFAWNDKVYHYQSGRRSDLPKSVRAGIAIHTFAIRDAIDKRRREYDFLGGEARYKQQLSLAQRPLVRLSATRQPVVDLARRVAKRGLDGARAVQKRLRDLWKLPDAVHDDAS